MVKTESVGGTGRVKPASSCLGTKFAAKCNRRLRNWRTIR